LWGWGAIKLVPSRGTPWRKNGKFGRVAKEKMSSLREDEGFVNKGWSCCEQSGMGTVWAMRAWGFGEVQNASITVPPREGSAEAD